MLGNLDFAVHRSLVDDDYFQRHVIPSQASMLADRLSQTLASLFKREESPEKSQAADVLKTWLKEKPLLTEIFERALRFKANATVSKDRFEAVLYTMETPFDQTVMEGEWMEYGRAQLASHDTSLVKLCILPSIQVYNYETDTVALNNFVQKDGRQRGRVEERTVLTKAAVFLSAEPTF